MRSVVCFGGLHWDVKARLAERLRPGTSNPVTTSRTPGGVAANVARSLARLGVPVAIVSVVGEGAAPLLEAISAEGVDVSGVEVVSGAATASYTAVLEPDGSLAVGVADMAVYEHMDRQWGLRRAARGDLWFADANIPAEGVEALHAAAAGTDLFLDPVSVAKSVRIASALDGAACVFPDELEAAALTGEHDPEEAARALAAMGPRRVVVTAGAAGVVVADESGAVRRPAIAPARVTDVTGAGDAFVAGYLGGLALAADDPVRWGLAAASLAVETLETVPPDFGLARLLARL